MDRARTMEVLRRCPLAIVQRLVHCAIAVSTAVLWQSHKDNVRYTAFEENSKRKKFVGEVIKIERKKKKEKKKENKGNRCG